jgi:hypothetical protein
MPRLHQAVGRKSRYEAEAGRVKAGETFRMSQAPIVPKVTMQMLLDAGFNAFGLQLFAESFAGKIDPQNPNGGLPFSFSFRGLRFTIEREPGEEIDTRHH